MKTPPSAYVTPFALVSPKPVSWLWPSFIPLGMVSVLDGDPGLGKSTMVLDLAARLSNGQPMPDGYRPSWATSIILSAEDDLECVIRPRLDAAGANVDHIFTMQMPAQGDTSRDLEVCIEDMRALETVIKENGVKLVVIDPLVAFLPHEISANKDQDVRRALALLRRVAEATGAAIVAIRHLNKRGDSTNALYRGGGSIGIVGAARAGLLVARDPDCDNGDRRILAASKMNLAPLPPSYAFRLRAEPGGAHPRVSWEGVSGHRADALLAVAQTDDERGALAEAECFLLEALAGGSRHAREVEREARSAGIALRTYSRARRRLGVAAVKVGAHWELRLPKDAKCSVHGSHGSVGNHPRSDSGTRASGEDLAEGCQGCQPRINAADFREADDFDAAIRGLGFEPESRQ